MSPLVRTFEKYARPLLIALGWISAGRPVAPAGPLPITVTDSSIPLRTPHGGIVPCGVRIWYPVTLTGALPLIICNPVWASERDDNSVLSAELASHGFVVVALDDVKFDPPDFDGAESDTVLRQTLFEIDSEPDRQHMTMIGEPRIKLQVAKLQRVLDALAGGLPSWPKGAVFDLNRVGIFGASFGGAVALELAQVDPLRRIHAVVNLDGWLQGAHSEQPINVPFADFVSVRGMPSPDKVNSENLMKRYLARVRIRCDAMAERHLARRPDAVRIAIKGACHSDFYDKLYDGRRWLQWRPWRGPIIHPERMREILSRYMIAFFETHLKRRPSPLMQAPGPYREVVVQFGRSDPQEDVVVDHRLAPDKVALRG